MAQIDVLPTALAATAGAVRRAVDEIEPVPAADLGDAGVTAALGSYAQAWSGRALVTAAGEAARSLEGSARAYATVESLLLPQGMR